MFFRRGRKRPLGVIGVGIGKNFFWQISEKNIYYFLDINVSMLQPFSFFEIVMLSIYKKKYKRCPKSIILYSTKSSTLFQTFVSLFVLEIIENCFLHLEGLCFNFFGVKLQIRSFIRSIFCLFLKISTFEGNFWAKFICET